MVFTSLFPRLWPKLGVKPIDPAEDTVLVRLGASESVDIEYTDEFVDAVEPWRSGLDVWVGKSVWVRRREAEWLDITGAASY